MRQTASALVSLLFVVGCATSGEELKPICDDGLDNDGDGRIDLDDFGCDNANDEDETDEPRCGDGLVNRDAEECDVQDLGGASCVSEGFAGGVLQCAPNCVFSTVACVVLSQCNNGLDDDEDGLFDTDDPGCLNGTDAEEFFSLESCGDVQGPVFDLTFANNANVRATGSTEGTTDDFAPRDTSDDCDPALSSGELVFSYRLFEPARLRFSTDQAGTDFDTVLYVRSLDCANGGERCNDDGFLTTKSELILDLGAGDHFVFVDGFDGARGQFELLIEFQ
jgi:hypothetical protein